MMDFKQDYDDLVAQIRERNYQAGEATFIEGWHTDFKVVPVSQGGTKLNALNVIKVEPQEHFTLLWLQTMLYPDDTKLRDHFILLKDETFSTTPDEYELFRSTAKVQCDIDGLKQAIAELREGPDYGTTTEQVQALYRRIDEKRLLLTQLRELIAEQARLYQHVYKAFPKPLAPHLAAMDSAFESYTKALNPTRGITDSLGTQIKLP